MALLRLAYKHKLIILIMKHIYDMSLFINQNDHIFM